MKALTFDIYLLQPVLISKIGSGEENSSSSSDFISGSVIRGAIIQKYLQHHPDEDISTSAQGRELFFNNTTFYINGYLRDNDGCRMLPTPLSWRKEKDTSLNSGTKIWDFAIDVAQNASQPQLPGVGYALLKETGAIFSSPEKYLQIHNASETRGEKKADQSFVFRYDTLAKGQVFSAAIISKDEKLLNLILDLLKDRDLLLGGSRSAGYGQALAENVQIQPVEKWDEIPLKLAKCGESQVTVIELLSDAIIRDDFGQYQLDISSIIAKASQKGEPIKPVASFVRTHLIGGFNRKWGLPLPQAPAIQAGSIFVYHSADIDQNKLNSILESGCGERRNEGYGRIAVNWNTSKSFLGKHTPPNILDISASDQANNRELTPEMTQTIERILERDMRNLLEGKLAHALAKLSLTGPISNSQLSRVRQVVMNMDKTKGYDPINEHLNGLKDAKKQFDRARVKELKGLKNYSEDKKPGNGNQQGENNAQETPKFTIFPLLDWLQKGLGKEELIWKIYLQPDEKDQLLITGVKQEIAQAVKVEYVSRLLDGLFKKASRMNQ